MAAIRLMRRWSIPLATAVAAPIFTPVVFADSDKKNAEAETSRMVRPSDLPIYESPQEVLDFEYHGKERTSLEENIGVVRKEVEGVISATRSTREKIVHICETGKAHTMATMDYITDEENVLPRAGAITVGGLTGLVIGRKGGFLKKVLYTSTGALTAASLCYPRHAYQASQIALENAKDIGTIGYNFVAGVKPQNKVPSPPTEITKEEPAPEAVAEAAPVPTPTPELEGGEVRKVIPENVSVEDFLSPLDSVVQQSSDVTMWGFRLTDKPSEDLSPKSADVPSKPVVPEGFGTVAEVELDTKQITEEQEPQTASFSGQTQKSQVVTDESVVKEDVKKEETPFESEESEGLPLVKEENKDVGLEPELVATVADIPVLTEPKVEITSLENDSPVIEHESKGQDKMEGVTEAEIISLAAEHTEAKGETSGMTSVKDEMERQEADVLKNIGESREEDNVQKVGVVNKIINFFSNDKQSKPIEKNESQVKEIVIEGGEKVEEKIAEAVVKVAEVVEKEMVDVIKEAEVVEDVSKKIESVLEVVEDVASAAAKAAHDTPEIPESVAEKAELTKIVAEKVEEIVDTVEFVVENVEGTAEEIKEKAEDIENKMVELIESKEKREEIIEKAYDFVADKISELSSTETKEPTERAFETQEIDINAPKVSRLEEMSSNEENNESELISPKEKSTESQEIMDNEKISSGEIESAENSEKIGIVNKVIQFFKSDKEKSINPREVVEDPVSGAVSEEVEHGSEEVRQPTQVVEDVSKASESIVNVVEHGANEVTKITEVIEDVCEKAESGIDVAEDIASAAASAAHDIPGIPDFVEEKAEEAKDIAEEAKEVVSTVECITEKVESFVEHIKEEAEIFKDKSDHMASKSQEELQDIEGKGLEVLLTKDTSKQPEEVLVEEKTEHEKIKEPNLSLGVEESEDLPTVHEAEEIGKPVDVIHDEKDQKAGVVDKILEFFSSNKEDSEVVKEGVEPLVEKAVIEGGERVEKVAAEVVAEIAKDVVKDTEEISKVTEIVDDVSKKVEGVVDVVEDIANAAAKDIPGMPEFVKERAEETKEIAGEVKEVVGTVDVVAEKISDITEEIKKDAENIENKATELVDSKVKREELIEKAIDYVTGKSHEELTTMAAADEAKQYDDIVTEESQLVVNTDKTVHKEQEVREVEENIVKEDSNVTNVESMEKEKIGLVDKILQLFSNDESQDHVKEPEKTVVTEVAIIVGEKVEEKIAEAVREVTEVVEKEMVDTVKDAQVVEEVSQKVESALEVVEDIAGAAAKAAHETPEVPESVAEKAELTKDIAEKVENVISTVEHVAEKIKETAEEIQKEAETIGKKASELVESPEKREELIETTIEYVTGKAQEESKDIPAAKQTKENELDVSTIVTANREVIKPTEENEPTEVSGVANVNESIRKEETGLVNKILQFFTNDENQEPVKEHGKPPTEEVILESGDKIEEKIAEAVSDVAEVAEKEMVEVIKEAQVVEDRSQKVESTLEVVEDVAGAAAKAALETSEVPESVAETAELTKDIAEKLEEVTCAVEYIAEKIENTAEEIKKEAENIGNMAGELIESKEKREELLETAIEFVSGKAQEESTEVLTTDTAKQTREDEQNINTNEPVDREEMVKPTKENEPTEVSDVANINENIQKGETGLVNKILQFFTNEENQEPVKELEKPLSEEIVLEGGERIEEKIAEAVSDVAEVAEKEMMEVIKEAQVVEDISQKVESTLETVEDVTGAAAKAAHETPEVPESVAEIAELTKDIAEKVEEAIGTVEYIAEKIEGTAEGIKKEAENVESRAIELIESKEKQEELVENIMEFVVDKTKEKLASTEPTVMTRDADVSKVEQSEEKVPEEIEVVPKGEKLLEKISSIFSKKNTKSEQPTGVISDISTETDVSDSSTETVPEPVAGDVSSTEAATSVTGVAVSEDSQVQSTSDVTSTVEGVGDSVSGFSTPEIIDAPSVTSNVSEKDQDLVLEVKDKSLFEQLSDLVTSDVKQNISSTGASTSQTTNDSVHQLQEKIKSEDSNTVNPNKETKPSLLGKITTIFTDKGSSKVTKQIPNERSEMIKDDLKSDVFIVTAKPSHPVDVASEESAQQSKTSVSNLQQGWFRTGADVKQEGKDVIVQLTPNSPPEKDYGQSNPEDADMYTTRS